MAGHVFIDNDDYVDDNDDEYADDDDYDDDDDDLKGKLGDFFLPAQSFYRH